MSQAERLLRLRRLRRLREQVRDYPELYREVCRRIVQVECGTEIPYSFFGGLPPVGGGRQVPRLPTEDDWWARQNQ